MVWHVPNADIQAAFLNEAIDRKLHVPCNNKCYQLQKSLYGLNQALPLWFEKLKKGLKRFGLTQLEFSESASNFIDDTQ